MPNRELLRDHAAEGHAEDHALVPPNRIHQRRGILAVVVHGVRRWGLVGLSETPLVISQDFEGVS